MLNIYQLGKQTIKGGWVYNKRNQALLAKTAREMTIRWAADLLSDDNAVCVAVATTGLSDVYDEVVEIAVLDISGQLLFHSQFRPRKAIPPYVSRINQISQGDLEDKAGIASSWKQIARLLSGKRILAYNAEFVQKLMRNTAKIHNLPVLEGYVKPSWECAMVAWATFQMSLKWHKLSELVQFPDPHTPLDAARGALKLVEDLAAGKVPEVDVSHLQEPEKAVILDLNRRIRDARPVKIHYSKYPTGGGPLERTILPRALFQTREAFYLVGQESDGRGGAGPEKSYRLDHLSFPG